MVLATVPAAPPTTKNQRATSWPAPISAIVPYLLLSRLRASAFCLVLVGRASMPWIVNERCRLCNPAGRSKRAGKLPEGLGVPSPDHAASHSAWPLGPATRWCWVALRSSPEDTGPGREPPAPPGALADWTPQTRMGCTRFDLVGLE